MIFFTRVYLYNVTQGTAQLEISYSNQDYVFDGFCNPNSTFNCTASIGLDCFIDIPKCFITSIYTEYEKKDFTFYATVTGIQQLCELHSIGYNLLIEDQFPAQTFQVNSGDICQTVQEGDYNFYRLYPTTVSRPQDTIIRLTIKDITPGESLSLNFINADGHATNDCFDIQYTIDSDFTTDIVCGYDSAQFSVYGGSETINYLGNTIDYTISIEQISVNTITLVQNVTYVVDDNITDVCEHDYDYYYFRTNSRAGNGFVRFVITSDSGESLAWANRRYFGGPDCFNAGQCVENEFGCILFDVCDSIVEEYYVTVLVHGPYQITAYYEPTVISLVENLVYNDSVAITDLRVYSFQVSSSDIQPGTRLSFEFIGVEYGSIVAFVDFNSQPGPVDLFEDDGFCGFEFDTITPGANSSNYGSLVIDSCNLQVGTYFITVLGADTQVSGIRNITYGIRTLFFNLNIQTTTIDVNVPSIGNLVDYYVPDILENPYKAIQYFKVKASYSNTTALASVRVANVQGGILGVYVSEFFLSTPPSIYPNGTVQDLYTDLFYEDGIASGYFDETYIDIGVIPQPLSFSSPDLCGDSCAIACCITEPDVPSCAIPLYPGDWNYDYYYVAIIPLYQYDVGVSITYDLIVTEQEKFTPITSNTHIIRNMTNGNEETQFFVVSTSGQESIKIRPQVINGDSIYVLISDQQNPENATYLQEIFCSGRDYDVPSACDLNIFHRGIHPGPTIQNLYITVTGINATYSLAYFGGRANCHQFSGTGAREGLSFCEGLVPYSTTQFYDYSAKDNAAQCLFNELYNHFRVQPCWSGVTKECNATLQRFACYENFPRCDNQGFSVATCRKSCEAVVYECVNYFESVGLENFNCSSSRYLDNYDGDCTGNLDSNFFVHPSFPFGIGQDPNDLIFDFEKKTYNSAVSIQSSFAITFVAMIAFVFVF